MIPKNLGNVNTITDEIKYVVSRELQDVGLAEGEIRVVIDQFQIFQICLIVSSTLFCLEQVVIVTDLLGT